MQETKLPHLTNKVLMLLIHYLYGIKFSVRFIGYIIIGTRIHIMVKRLTIRTYIKRVRSIVITSIPKLIYTWRLGVRIIGRRERACERLISTLILPVRRS